MKNTLENKAKFFAQYWGQNVYNRIGWPGLCVNGKVEELESQFKLYSSNNKHPEAENTKTFLQLKPLSSITDEDAIEIAMMLVNWPDSMSKLTKIKVRKRKNGDHSSDVVVMEFSGSFKYTIRYRGNDWMGWIDNDSRSQWSLNNYTQVSDYLRSKGYALPYVGLSVEKQIEYGWVKLAI